jgi:site-specific DNA-cytosine methylase
MQPTGSRTPASVADPRPLGVNKRKGRFNDQYKLRGWDEAAGTVTGNTDIQEGAQSVADPRLALDKPAFGHAHKVTGWDEAAGTVTHSPSPASGGGAVADPRLGRGGDNIPFNDQLRVDGWEDPVGAVTSSHRKAVADPRGLELKATADGADAFGGRPGLFGVTDWNKPAPSVTGKMGAASGSVPGSIADPRVQLEHSPHNDSFGVSAWKDPAATVRGASSIRTSKSAVADPRVPTTDTSQIHEVVKSEDSARRNGSLGVLDWTEPSKTVTGESYPSNGSASVADPRLGTGQGPGGHNNKMAVADWNEPAPTVIGATRPGGGAASVAEPVDLRLQFKVGRAHRHFETSGMYGVLSWEEAAWTITGSASVDNGRFAIADPRKPPDFIPVILSPWDGTWHRPLTTLELAVLQSLPAEVDGKPLKLAGKSVAKWRERVGNAVPRHAGRAIAETLLLALLAAALGTWTLGSTGIWVRKTDGLTEEEVNAPYEREAVA